jgi:hypothetical protein
MGAAMRRRLALRLRIDEKIAIATRHDNRGLVAETWLVNIGEPA